MESVLDPIIEEIIKDQRYKICKNGKIYARIPASGPLSQTKNYNFREIGTVRNGYHLIRYNDKCVRSHRVVYRKHVGKLDPWKEINHMDGNKLNNNIKNLELVTPEENQRHEKDAGLLTVGANCSWSKLNATKVREIRKKLKSGVGARALGREYSVHHSVITSIKQRKTWAHVK